MKPAAIARRTGVSYSSVYGLTRLQERGFNSLAEYQDDLARRRGFDSRYESDRHRAKEKGFSSIHAYREYHAKGRGFSSLHDYREYQSREQGFASRSEHTEHLAERRRTRRKNSILSGILSESLSELDRTQAWLARQLGVSRQMVSRYVSGSAMPARDKLGGLLDIICPDEEIRSRLYEELVDE